MGIKALSDGNPDGTRLGQSSSDLIGFYGLSVPIAQRSSSAMATLTITVTSVTGKFAFATSAKMQAFVDQVKEIRDTLVAYGLHAGS